MERDYGLERIAQLICEPLEDSLRKLEEKIYFCGNSLNYEARDVINKIKSYDQEVANGREN